MTMTEVSDTNRIDVAPFAAIIQDHLRRRGLTAMEAAAMCGYYKDSRGSGDVTRLQRRLGLSPEPGGKVSRRISYNVAVHIARSVGLDPIDVDL